MDEDELPSCNSLFKNVVHFSEKFLLLHLSKLTRTRLDLKYKSEDEKYCYIKNVEKDSFKCLTSLKSLELICDKNLIENGLNKHFSTNDLQELNISCDALDEIDYNLFKEVQNTLTKLSLFNCQITQIHDDTFKDMKKLIKLDLSWNHFDINNSNNFFINHLENLESLDMIRCGLHTIENNVFSNLVNLRELNLKINQFDTIKSNWFRGLCNLKILNLSNCEISIVENDSFKDLYNLEELDLSENKIDTIQTKSLKNLPNLKILDLKRCQIKSIEENSFDKMLNLEELYLTKNKIHLLKAEQFNGLINLKVLDLRGNNLAEISNKPFVNLNKLEDLFLHDFDFTSKTQRNHELMKIKTNNNLILNEFDF
jgi:Leucine-rich repeat (LRR) protein